ncbi:nucleotide sugar dehydrogenase [Pseudactinotalea terrae]|uniref:nucleotide sugar dehydrogenase n=1 Tax=Pseudactinotalea terrae TaxID=1743262 RepID=UPI0012E1E149|nr:nucleotide sugar dehydrogenase [Pseudactinotalea terrae]
MSPGEVTIGVIGLGYVGLPLAVSFAKKYEVLGFDINESRIAELAQGYDRTRELSREELSAAIQLTFSGDPVSLDGVNVYIVTTPTPIDEHKTPNLGPVLAATRSVAASLRPGDTVIYESTVYPGATEEECVPLLEELSGLRLNKDFWVGYSPERINPGDKQHRFETITKVTSGSTDEAANFIDALYASVVVAGTHKAPSIKVAEAAKVIENTQRDVNIALINELAMIFNKLEIDTQDVLEAAGTKWNFLRFQPGLVGGHCIGVDPYYLTHKAQAVGHNPEIILAGRRLNDSMGEYVAGQLVRAMVKQGIDLRNARILILGLTFKENTPDLRNTRVVDIIDELRSYGIEVDVYDPWVDPAEAKHEYGLEMLREPKADTYDGIILAVGHRDFQIQGAAAVKRWGKKSQVFFDLKSILPRKDSDLRL